MVNTMQGGGLQPPQRCLRVCLLGDPGTGQSALLRAQAGDESGQPALNETMVTSMVLDGEPWLVRLTDNLGDPRYDEMRSAALSSAHLILLCFSVDSPQSLLRVRERWAPLVWAADSEAPTFLVGTKADLREAGGETPCLDEEAGRRAASQLGAFGYLECSAVHPESVQLAVDEALAAAKEYYFLQWQLCADPDYEEGRPVRRLVTCAHLNQEDDVPAWLGHERLNVNEDPRPLDELAAKGGLSLLGRTHCRRHAYLKMDLAGQSITSLDAIRPYVHLQFVNLSNNQLRSLEPLCALRNLLQLDASRNCLLRTESFAAPEALEVVDLSYNLLGDIGDWGVHKYLKKLSLRGNFIGKIGPGLRTNRQLRTLDLSENAIAKLQNLDNLELRELYLAQNQITSLDGIHSLGKLHELNVRHNNITSVAALDAKDVPRLKKLCIAENRISQIAEVANLNGFQNLCDLLIAPNPVVELPHYRAQVLHRLPRLRSIDGSSVAADEKTKADLIYGFDVAARQVAFEELLPQETFVDRRLITEEGIAGEEGQQFGAQGDAGPYGLASLVPSSDPHTGGRTQFQDAKFRQLLERTRAGGEAGTADFCNFPAPFVECNIGDADVSAIFEAALEGGVHTVLLANSSLTVAGVAEVVSQLSAPGALRHVDLCGCPAVGEMRQELMHLFPFARGRSMEAEDCGLSEADVQRLRNQTPEAEAALEAQAAERARTAAMVEEYLKRQEVLEDFAAENCSADVPPPSPYLLCHPARWREGIEAETLAVYKAFVAVNPAGFVSNAQTNSSWVKLKNGCSKILDGDEMLVLRRQRDAMLRDWGCILPETSTFDPIEDGEFDDSYDYPEGYGRDRSATEGYYAGSEIGGRPLPPPFLRAFGGEEQLLDNMHLLAFMPWVGVVVDKEAVAEIRRKREEWEREWRERQERYNTLSEACRKIYDTAPQFAGSGSGQLIAHFTYLCGKQTYLTGTEKPLPPSQFGLKKVGVDARPAPRRGQDLHEALTGGGLALAAATGQSFGSNSVTITLQSQLAYGCKVVVRQGSIFQHVDWQHRQNLCIGMDYVLEVPAGGTLTKQMHAHCLNVTCACSNGNPMDLTDFYFDDLVVLESQGKIWDHFEKAFGGR